MIGADFATPGGLIAVAATYPADDERLASKRWEELAQRMRAEYGEPMQFSAPPKTRTEAIAEAYPDTQNKARIVTLLGASAPGRYQELDTLIVKGEWSPSAIWQFSNAVVLVIVNDKRDANGKHMLKPMWMFGTKAGWTAVNQSQPKDF
jgi:hypothetical protein